MNKDLYCSYNIEKGTLNNCALKTSLCKNKSYKNATFWKIKATFGTFKSYKKIALIIILVHLKMYDNVESHFLMCGIMGTLKRAKFN